MKKNISKNPKLYYILKNKFNKDKIIKEIADYQLLSESKYFNEKFYTKNYNIKGTDPIIHYLYYGYKEGKKPSNTFNTSYYLKKYEDIKKSGMNPLVHYIKYGEKEGRFKNKIVENNFNKCKNALIANKLFNPEDYLKKYPEVKKFKFNRFIKTPLDYFLKFGLKEGHILNNFDKKYYLNKYPSVKKMGINPMIHYITYGANVGNFKNKKEEENFNDLKEKIVNSKLFDEKYYITKYSEVKNFKYKKYMPSALDYFIKFGIQKNHNPDPNFDTEYYLKKYPSVKKMGISPIAHYIKHGINVKNFKNIKEEENFNDLKEKIVNSKLFDEKYYVNTYPEVKNFKYKKYMPSALDYFIKFGIQKNHNPNKDFDTNYYLKKYPSVKKMGISPIAHYIQYGINVGNFKNAKEEKAFNDLKEKIVKNKLFDEKYYLNAYSEVKNFEYKKYISTLDYFIKFGIQKNHNPDPNFDTEYYLKKYPSVKKMGMNPLIHYITYGLNVKNFKNQNEEKDHEDLKEKIIKSKLFNEKYYENKYPEVKNFKYKKYISTLDYFIKFGIQKNHIPTQDFDARFYLKTYVDVKKSGMNPFIHYVEHGMNENKIPKLNQMKEQILKKNLNLLTNPTFDSYPLVSIIIINRNGLNYLKLLFKDFKKNIVYPNYEIIIVDNNSTDNSIQYLKELSKNLSLRIIPNNENENFSKANNNASKIAKGEYLLFLNNDIETTYGWLNEMMGVIINNKDNEKSNIGIVGAKCIFPYSHQNNNSLKLQNFGLDLYFDKSNGIFTGGNNHMGKDPFDNTLKTKQVNFISGAVFLIKNQLYQEIGGFNEEYNWGWEDFDFCMKLLKNGYNNYICSSALLFHDESSTRKKENSVVFRDKNIALFNENWSKYLLKSIFKNSLDIKSFLSMLNIDKTSTKHDILKIKSILKNILIIIPNENIFNNIEKNKIIMEKNKINIFPILINEKYISIYGFFKGQLILLTKLNYNLKLKNDLNNFNKHFFDEINLNILNNFLITEIYVIKSFKYREIPYFPLISPIVYSNNINMRINYIDEITEINIFKNNIMDNINSTNQLIDFKKNKLVIYTAIIGKYDDLKEPYIINPDFDYICFTDNKELKSDIWEIIVIDKKNLQNQDLDNTKIARMFKTLPHKYLSKYNYSLWIDAGFRIIGSVEKYINTYLKNGKILGIKHSNRNCIYDEAKKVVDIKKEDKKIVNDVIKRYKSKNYPKNNGLIESGILFRKHNDKQIIKLDEEWWNEILNFSKRDQLSFDYVMWKNNFEYDKTDIFYWTNQYFEHTRHFHERPHKKQEIKKLTNNNTNNTNNTNNNITKLHKMKEIDKKEFNQLKNDFTTLKKEFNEFLRRFKLKHINKEKIASEIENFKGYGINVENNRRFKLIVSLTSFPKRMYDVHYTLYSLLKQSLKPDNIILWLSKEEFPNLLEDVPIKVKNLQKYGLTIEFVDENLKQYKKLIHALERYPKDIIITADDDVYYPKDWLEKLYMNYDPKAVVCHRGHRIKLNNNGDIESYLKWNWQSNNSERSVFNFATGVGGVMYPSGVLYKDILNQKLFMKLAPTNDDMWFWAMTIMNNKKIKIIDNGYNVPNLVNPERELGFNDDGALGLINNSKNKNDEYIKNILRYYPKIKNKLKLENNEFNIKS
ncbi:MAG: glycosyltransferase [Methanobrevibacter sp.]|jgi:GT2 family glycosyltransferase|nr:glycosyltransferase [Candidatus Methanoflexus mossambicus]